MINKLFKLSCTVPILFLLAGCSAVGSKTGTISSVYIVTSIAAVLLLVAYWLLIKKREPWFILLFSCVTIVNIGYLTLSLSANLNEALLSNRIAYLGSVFLPLSMFMSIVKSCKINFPRWAIGVLLSLSAVVFIIAASPGYLDIYYKEVTLTKIDGATVLEKVYGPLHSIYLYYLVGYFSAMIAVIIYARVRKKFNHTTHAVLLLSTVLINICVWFMEQLVNINFEFLSVSYIASEVSLLGINMLIQELSLQKAFRTNSETNKNDIAQPQLSPDTSESTVQNPPTEDELSVKAKYFSDNLSTLTPTERKIYTLYIEGNKTTAVMTELSITENTLKYHNRNLYSKLGVSNRKELVEVAKYIKE